MSYRIIILLMIVLVAAPCGSQGTNNSKTAASQFVGKWTGKWDEKLRAEFNIIPVDGDKARVVYQWEDVSGGTMRTTSMLGWIDGDKLNVSRVISIQLSTDDKNKATAYKDYKSTRTATLTRSSLEPQKK